MFVKHTYVDAHSCVFGDVFKMYGHDRLPEMCVERVQHVGDVCAWCVWMLCLV